MQYYKEEMTQEHIDLARSNNIDYQTLWKRYNYYDWTLEDATTKPVAVRGASKHTHFIAIAKKNGICRSVYYKRIAEGMTQEDASSIPTIIGRPRKNLTN